MLKKRTKALQFSQETINQIGERDERCIFCKMWYNMPSKPKYEHAILDIMHIVPKSQGGLGIEENGVLGCRYHHSLLDNGNKGLRAEMMDMIEGYMKDKYPEWDKSKLVYKKYDM